MSVTVEAPMTPGDVEVSSQYRKRAESGYESAGLRVQFRYEGEPGLQFQVEVSDAYRNAIKRGIREAMSRRFPAFPETGSIWVVEIMEDADSSERAFYRAAVALVEQAYIIALSGSPQF